MQQADFIWMNGELVRWEDAKVHVLTHALHYGSGVFEGIRAYETERGTAVFRHQDHLDRLRRSAELYYMELPYTVEKLREATHELIRANKLRSCYIRPMAYRGYGEMGLFPLNLPVDVFIAVWSWGAYLGEEGQKHGVRCKVSSWRRMSDASFIPQAKASGTYLNSILGEGRDREGGLRRGRSCSTTTATSRRARGRTCSSCATGASRLRPPAPRSWTASRPAPSSRSRRTSASRWSSATSRGASCTRPTRSS